jgi:hypothetical protein
VGGRGAGALVQGGRHPVDAVDGTKVHLSVPVDMQVCSLDCEHSGH